MYYIVVDFEWNQPLSYNSKSFRLIEDKLLFEIIEIGAVKLDSSFNIIDRFKQIIKPQYFTKIHPRIKRITNLSNDEVEDQPSFVEAQKRFSNFCGDNPCFITWGSEDVSVYKQNLDCFEVEYDELNFYNLQRMFSQRYVKTKQQSGLKPAMEALGIVEKEDMPFHDALSDAYYTALIYQNMPDREQILQYPQEAKKLTHNSKFKSSITKHQVLSVKHALNSDLITKPVCPACRKPCTIIGEVVQQSPNSYIALVKCESHGGLFMQARFGIMPNRNVGLLLKLMPCTKDHKKYIKIKSYQNIIDSKLNRPNGVLPNINQLNSYPFDDD